MRVTPWIAAALILSFVTPAFAQEEWDNFKFPEDGFEVNFPGSPRYRTLPIPPSTDTSCPPRSIPPHTDASDTP